MIFGVLGWNVVLINLFFDGIIIKFVYIKNNKMIFFVLFW